MTRRLPRRLADIGDTQLYVVEVGEAVGYPILVLHGGPGDDHTEFGDYLDPLADRGYRLFLVDQRAQGRSDKAPQQTWTLQQMAADVSALADALGLDRYAALGHSYGAFVAIQHAVDHPGAAAQTIVSSGVPSGRFLDRIQSELDAFEPIELREQVAASWARETEVRTHEDFAEILRDQMPFQFADPLDPRIEEYLRRSEGRGVPARRPPALRGAGLRRHRGRRPAPRGHRTGSGPGRPARPDLLRRGCRGHGF